MAKKKASRKKARRTSAARRGSVVVLSNPADNGRYELLCCGEFVYKLDTQSGTVWLNKAGGYPR